MPMLRERPKMRTIEAESIDVAFSGGLGCNSDEASVKEVERRAGVICLRRIDNRIGGRIIVLKQGSFLRPRWRKPYESRGSRTVLRGVGVKLPSLLTFSINPFVETDIDRSG